MNYCTCYHDDDDDDDEDDDDVVDDDDKYIDEIMTKWMVFMMIMFVWKNCIFKHQPSLPLLMYDV